MISKAVLGDPVSRPRASTSFQAPSACPRSCRHCSKAVMITQHLWDRPPAPLPPRGVVDPVRLPTGPLLLPPPVAGMREPGGLLGLILAQRYAAAAGWLKKFELQRWLTRASSTDMFMAANS